MKIKNCYKKMDFFQILEQESPRNIGQQVSCEI